MRRMKGKKGAMAIKIDLEKAYDRIRWTFIQDTLAEARFPATMIELIMKCISTSSLQISWNGAASPPFYPSRGIRQGDPISPYIFVLCMERLGHLIQVAVRRKAWKPLKASAGGPKITHLFFADDLLLFSEASLEQAHVIRGCLDQFCCLSGQKVSKEKSRIFFSHNVARDRAGTLSTQFGFQRTRELGKHLGVPIIHKRVSKNTFTYLVDKAQKRLQGWQSKHLSLAGRVTLAKAVLTALPIYTMQTVRLPRATCDTLDKLCRSFVWGSSLQQRKLHLVQWETLCNPKLCGGLGLRKMRTMNDALSMKIAWNLVNCRDKLWVRVFRCKYLNNQGQAPLLLKKKQGSNLWSAIYKVWPAFRDELSWKVGNGETVLFWEDNWARFDVPLLQLQSNIPEGLLNKPITALTQGAAWNWRLLQPFLVPEVGNWLWSEPTPQPNQGEDQACWPKGVKNGFTVTSAYCLLESALWETEKLIWKVIWGWHGPLRITFFLWLLAQNKLLTNELRVRRHLATSPLCPRCYQFEESCLHVVRDCVHATDIWFAVSEGKLPDDFFMLPLQLWLCTNLDARIEDGRWCVLFATVCWSLWHWRNQLVFNPEGDVAINPVKCIVSRVNEFMRANKCPRFSLRATNQTMPTEAWSPPPPGALKINIAVSSSNSNSIRTCGGVCRDFAGFWRAGFVSALEPCNMFEADLLAILHGLQFARKCGIQSVLLETEAVAALEWLWDDISWGLDFDVLMKEIRALQSCFNSVSFDFVQNEANYVAHGMARLSPPLSPGVTVIDTPPLLIRNLLLVDRGVTGC